MRETTDTPTLASEALRSSLGESRAAELTGLGGVLRGGSVRSGPAQTVDGDLLVHDEEPADDFPLAGPEQSYTEQDKPFRVRQRKRTGPA